jgi:NADPH:quinone reductase-like Zn-dependent oxidoreductase
MRPASESIALQRKETTMHAASEMSTTIGSAKAVRRTMHAIVHRQYGPPDVLAFEEIERPVPGDDEVLVRVCAAGASIGDHHIVTGTPYVIRLSLGGLLRPRNRVPGATIAGVVEAVGAKVTTIRPGDEVYGAAATGAFAEYIAVPTKLIAPKPTNLSFEEAAATPWAVAALQCLRDAGSLKAGQRVLINGASGGVGTWAVQIAKALDAEVTAVCSAHNVEMVRALGADEVIDYTKDDFVKGGPRFNLILDTVGNRSVSDCRSVLLSNGIFVSCSGGNSSTRWLSRLLWMRIASRFTSQKLKTFIVSPNQKDLFVLRDLVEAGKAKPVIERCYELSEVADALRHVGEGHARGQTVIRIAG